MGEANKSGLSKNDWLGPESEWRARTAQEAITTLGLEGLHFTEVERKCIDRFVAGEIDLDELRRIWDAEPSRLNQDGGAPA
jgi:hypothetical protein